MAKPREIFDRLNITAETVSVFMVLIVFFCSLFYFQNGGVAIVATFFIMIVFAVPAPIIGAALAVPFALWNLLKIFKR